MDMSLIACTYCLHRRIDAFDLWCWRRLLRGPWTARTSNLSILKEINLEYSLEGLMLKPQYFGHLMQRADYLEKTLMLKQIEGNRTRGQERIRWLDSITNSMDNNLSNSGRWWRTEEPGMLQSMQSQRLSDWTTTTNRNQIYNKQIYSLLITPFHHLTANPT